MALSFRCPECQTDLVLSAARPGRPAECTACGSTITVPLDSVRLDLRKSPGPVGAGAEPALPDGEEIPDEIRRFRFNWGAFLLTPIWLFFHGRIALGVLLVGLAAASNFAGVVSPVVPILSFPVFLALAIYFGVRGYRIAWSDAGIYDTLDDVKRRERNWAVIGLVVVVGMIALRVLVGV
jgi:hypothetical protein